LAYYFPPPPPLFYPYPLNYLFYPFHKLYLPIPTQYVILEFIGRFSLNFIISPCFVFHTQFYPVNLFLCSKGNDRLQFQYGTRPTLSPPPPCHSKYLQVRVAPPPTNPSQTPSAHTIEPLGFKPRKAIQPDLFLPSFKRTYCHF
jgi:hypothetical protein